MSEIPLAYLSELIDVRIQCFEFEFQINPIPLLDPVIVCKLWTDAAMLHDL